MKNDAGVYIRMKLSVISMALAMPWIAASAMSSSSTILADRFTHFSVFELDRGNLHDVQKVLGPSNVRRTGDGGDAETSICYSVPAGEVEFKSGELGGSDDELLGFSLSRQKHGDACPPWPRQVPLPAMQIGGVTLGISAREFATSLKVPVKWRGNIGTADFENLSVPTPAEIRDLPGDLRIQAEKHPETSMVDVGVSVEGTFDQGRLVKLEIWKTQTY